MSRSVGNKPCPLCHSKDAIHERVLNGLELLRCRHCTFVFVNLSEEQIGEANSQFDDEDVASYQEETLHTIDQKWFERIVDRISKHCGTGRVLDIGCGRGALLRAFMSRGWKACGVDPSPWALPYSESYGFKLYQGFLETSPLPENSFDVISSTSTFEHVPDPLSHIKAVLLALKSGGIAYFCGMPNYGKLSIRLNISTFHHNTPPRHVNYFTYRSLKYLFSIPSVANNFRSVHIGTYGIPDIHPLYNFLSRYVSQLRRKSKVLGTSPTGSPSESTSKKKKGLAELAVHAYYNLGAPLHLGDKLEVIAFKA